MLGQVSDGELGEISVAGHAWGVSCGRPLLAAGASISMFARKFGRNAARILLAEVAVQILSVVACVESRLESLHSLPVLETDEYLASHRSLVITENPGEPHLVDEPARSAVSDRHPSLKQRDRSSARFDHDLDCLVKEGVSFAALFAAALSRTAGRTYVEQASFEGRARDRLEELGDLSGLAVGDQRALSSSNFGLVWRHDHHVAHSQKQLGAFLIQNNSTVHAAGHLEGDAARHVALDQASHHIRLRSLGREDQMEADGPRLLGDSHDGMFDFLVGHHQVGELIDDEDHIGKFFR